MTVAIARDALGRFRKAARIEPLPVKAPANLQEFPYIDNDPSCWIGRDGSIYFVNDNGGSHSSTCRRITDTTDGMWKLEGEGWLHMSYTNIYTGYDQRRGREIAPTQAQVDAVFDLAMAAQAVAEERHGRKFVSERLFAWVADQHEKENA